MFRQMRRFKQELSKEETETILSRGTTGILGLNGDDGYPYTVPVNYLYRNGRIIFHGAKAGHKFDSIMRDDKVSFCVIDHDELVPDKLTDYYRSVIAFGRIHLLEDPDAIREAALCFGMRYNPDRDKNTAEIEKEINVLACFEITVEHVTGKESIEFVRRRSQ